MQTQVRQALARPRMAHALRPSAASSQRIIGDLRNTKWSTRREERYRIVSSHRAGLSRPAVQQSSQSDASEAGEESEQETDKWGSGEIQVVDLIHEEEDDQDKPLHKVHDAQVSMRLPQNMFRKICHFPSVLSRLNLSHVPSEAEHLTHGPVVVRCSFSHTTFIVPERHSAGLLVRFTSLHRFLPAGVYAPG